jgi:hypothetical protein
MVCPLPSIRPNRRSHTLFSVDLTARRFDHEKPHHCRKVVTDTDIAMVLNRACLPFLVFGGTLVLRHAIAWRFANDNLDSEVPGVSED